MLISGDTIFKEGIGRTDLPGGSYNDMKDSLQKILNMNDDIIIIPGHGPETTIGYERTNNPYINLWFIYYS